ncbi:MAG: DUF2207 domain-containing protein, partial [Candidatus Heimdallarchaeaceae archaeon]
MVSVAKIVFLSILSLLIGLILGWIFSSPYKITLLLFALLPFLFVVIIVLLPLFFKWIRKWKHYLGLSERQVLVLIFGLMFIGTLLSMSLSGILPKGSELALTNNPYVGPYTLNIDLLPEKALVTESLVYHIPSGVKGHELYRSYYKKGPLANMKVVEILCPQGLTKKTYYKKDRIELACRSSYHAKSGVYNIESEFADFEGTQANLRPGVYEITFKYEIPKPYICYDKLCLFDWNVLTDFSLDIKNARVHVNGAKQVWGYPPLDSSFDIPARTLLRVKATKPKNEVTSYWMEKNEPDSEIFVNELPLYIAGFFYKFGWIVSLSILGIIIAGLYLIYILFGKEHRVSGVPDVLHYPPTNRKPYDVNRIVFGDPNKIEFE